MTNLLYRNDKLLTVHDKCWKKSPSISMQFATPEPKSLVVRQKLIFAFLYAGSSIQNVREQFFSCINIYFATLARY